MSRLIVLLGAVLVTGSAPARAADHLKCYKIKDPLKLAGVADLDTPQFGADPGCTVSSAKLFCVPGTKVVDSATDKLTGNPITPLPFSSAPPPGDSVCYKVKCPQPPTPIADQQATDQFGTRTLAKLKASMICTPAVKGTAFCGNGTIDPGEQCEPTNLGAATCRSRGFPHGGTLACAPGCTFDTSGCRRTGLPATGQMTCWDSGGLVVSCGGTGQDGELQAGTTLSYLDNGNGTFTDLNTGLVWAKTSDDGSIHDRDNTYLWTDAAAVHVAMINSTSFAGQTDWRVPNAKELTSLVNYELAVPSITGAFNFNCVPGCTVTTCSCTAPSRHWTSTTNVFAPFEAWSVTFQEGGLGSFGKANNFFVRAVRAGS